MPEIIVASCPNGPVAYRNNLTSRFTARFSATCPLTNQPCLKTSAILGPLTLLPDSGNSTAHELRISFFSQRDRSELWAGQATASRRARHGTQGGWPFLGPNLTRSTDANMTHLLNPELLRRLQFLRYRYHFLALYVLIGFLSIILEILCFQAMEHSGIPPPWPYFPG
jgi:hypothetical protein